MKRIRTGLAILGAIWLLGCATPHLVTLKDGSTIETKDDPKYDAKSGFYEFETRTGEKKRLNKDEVRSIKELD